MIINEEVYGNIATVYHRSQTPPDRFKEILEKNEWKSGIGAGNLYGPGLYTVFTKSSNNRGYGKYLYKMHVKGIKNFFIFSRKRNTDLVFAAFLNFFPDK